MKTIAFVFCIILSGCVANLQTLESVAKTESARLTPPAERFSSYANYELRPMVLSPAVQSEAGKVKAAGELEDTRGPSFSPCLISGKRLHLAAGRAHSSSSPSLRF